MGTLHLKGHDAVSFFHSFFHPTEAEQKIKRSIEHEVSIMDTKSGFEGKIEGLDLSFLSDYEGK